MQSLLQNCFTEWILKTSIFKISSHQFIYFQSTEYHHQLDADSKPVLFIIIVRMNDLVN